MNQNSPFITRQNNLVGLLEKSGLDAFVFNPGASFYYLTGLHFHLMERPTILIFVPSKTPILILPELEKLKLDNLDFPLEAYLYGEDPNLWSHVVKQAMDKIGLKKGKIGVEPTQLRYLELQLLENASPGSSFVSAEHIVADQRMRKDSNEISAMCKAVDIAQTALSSSLPFIKIGITERELASELTLQLLRAGSDPALPFSPIVSFGENTANPHAAPSDRPLSNGDLLLVDWGAAYRGYLSDLTRTFAIQPFDQEFSTIHRIVLNANQAGQSIIRPGISAEAVDNAARAVIQESGYGEFFFHRTGHGLGLEAHEPPYIRSGNNLSIAPGMTFTIEPGIYLHGRGGIRIEDNVVVTEDSMECLSSITRDLTVLL